MFSNPISRKVKGMKTGDLDTSQPLSKPKYQEGERNENMGFGQREKMIMKTQMASLFSRGGSSKYKFVSPPAIRALTLPPAYPDKVQFKPPMLPPDWGDKGAEGHQKVAATMSAWITVILVVITILAILYTIFKKCIISAKSMLPLIPVQLNTPRHHENGHFCRGRKLSLCRGNVGALHNSGHSSITITNHRLPNCV